MSRRWSFAWRMSVRVVNAWLALVSLGLAFLAMLIPDLRGVSVGLVVPLLAAIQAAFVFAPDDEPALELMLSSPRPASWLIYERLVLMLGMQIGVGLLWSLVLQAVAGRPLVLDNILWWLPPTLALTGLSLAVTLMMRRSSFGVLAGIGVFAMMLLFFDSVVMDQNWLYPLHLFLQPGWFSNEHYLLNRVVVSLIGVGLIGAVVYAMRDEENLLGGQNR